MSADRPLLGIQAMIAATFFYTLCDAIGKWVVADHSVFMLLTVRSLAAGAIALFLLRKLGLASLWRVEQPGLVWLRIAAATAETTLFFIAVQYLSLSATLSIYLAAPIVVALAAPWLLAERLTAAKLLASILGFAGVLLLLRPGGDSFGIAAIVALFGMLALALTLITARSLRAVEPAVLVMHQILGTLVVGLAGLVWIDRSAWPGALDLGLMAAVGISAMVAQFFVAFSMRLAPASLVSPFFYSALIWALLADALVWQVFPTPFSLAAAALIVAAGIWLGRHSA